METTHTCAEDKHSPISRVIRRNAVMHEASLYNMILGHHNDSVDHCCDNSFQAT